jgi:hypothetical protein
MAEAFLGDLAGDEIRRHVTEFVEQHHNPGSGKERSAWK